MVDLAGRMNCPICGRKAMLHDKEYINGDFKKIRNIYECENCELFFRMPRGGMKKRSYINLNEDARGDLVDLTETIASVKYGFTEVD